jgi:hypothetical protein
VIDAMKPNHLPSPPWEKDIDAMFAERERKNLPPPVGRRLSGTHDGSYNRVKW